MTPECRQAKKKKVVLLYIREAEIIANNANVAAVAAETCDAPDRQSTIS